MKTFNKAASRVLMFALILVLTACGSTKIPIDYADAVSFEAALNNGENLEGKIVQFVVSEVHPNSAFGYNLFAGEHLNFVSARNPDVKEGDVLVVQVTTISSFLGSWIIQYEKVENASAGHTAISSDNEGRASSEATHGSDSPVLPLELTDYGWYISDPSRDPAYVDFCGMIYNPNKELIARFPKVLVTVKNGDGTIMATGHQTGTIVMPEDTITLCGIFSLPTADLTEDSVIIFDVEWSELGTDTFIYSGARTTDFIITNVSEKSSGRENFITGEITNNYSEDIDKVNLSIVLRKDGRIVYMENTFIDNLKVGKPKAFQISMYSDWPEHDTIDVSAMVW